MTRYTPVCTRAGHKQMSIAEQGSLCVHKRTDTGDEAGGRSGPCCGISLAGWGTSWSLLDFFFFFFLGWIFLFRLRYIWRGINQQAHMKFLLLQ